MTTRSLILSPHEIRAALAGTLGLVVRPATGLGGTRAEDQMKKCPLGVPGDRLCCKEGWADVNTESGPAVTYRSDNSLHFCQDDAFPIEYDRYPGMKFTMWCGDLWRGEPGHSWRSPATMPQWASRVTLEVVGVRCVRLIDLTDDDAIHALGAWRKGGEDDPFDEEVTSNNPLGDFCTHWDAKYGSRYPWETSWAWAVEVRRVDG